MLIQKHVVLGEIMLTDFKKIMPQNTGLINQVSNLLLRFTETKRERTVGDWLAWQVGCVSTWLAACLDNI